MTSEETPPAHSAAEAPEAEGPETPEAETPEAGDPATGADRADPGAEPVDELADELARDAGEDDDIDDTPLEPAAEDTVAEREHVVDSDAPGGDVGATGRGQAALDARVAQALAAQRLVRDSRDR